MGWNPFARKENAVQDPMMDRYSSGETREPPPSSPASEDDFDPNEFFSPSETKAEEELTTVGFLKRLNLVDRVGRIDEDAYRQQIVMAIREVIQYGNPTQEQHQTLNNQVRRLNNDMPLTGETAALIQKELREAFSKSGDKSQL